MSSFEGSIASLRGSGNQRSRTSTGARKAKRVALFLASGALTACTSIGGVSPESIGERHNQGVGYVLGNLRTLPPRNQLLGRVTELTLENCRITRRRCHLPASTPATFNGRPTDVGQYIVGLSGSRAYKTSLTELFGISPGAVDLAGFERSLSGIEARAAAQLRGAEHTNFIQVAGVARSSARLWAPVEQGGRDGGGITFPPTSGARPKINWQEVYEADAAGCLASLPFCLDGAILASAADIAWQLYHD